MKGPLLAACVLAAGACAPAREARTVVAEGWAGGEGEGARTRAVWDALRRAVEIAGAVRVEARTRVDRGAGADSRVTARSAGCVLEHRVLESGEFERGVRARVRAAVSADPAACARSGELPPPYLDDSTVSVEFHGLGPRSGDAAQAAGAELRRSLAGRGVPVLARRGEYLVEGEARVFDEDDPRLRPFVGARVELGARVVSARDGRVVREARREAVSYELDRGAAARTAAAAAGAEAAAEVLAALDEAAWSSPARR